MSDSIAYAKASIRFLQAKTGASIEACQAAMNASDGNLMSAWRNLAPNETVLQFHDMYTWGDFERIDDPERDLPRCTADSMFTFRCPETTDHRGDKSIAPFGDRNELSDIHGALLWSACYPVSWDDRERYRSPTLQGRLMEIGDRIREKLKRSRSTERNRLFREALLKLERAKDEYFDRDVSSGQRTLFEVEELLRQGNKAR